MNFTHSDCVMWPNYPGANVVGAALKFIMGKKVNHQAFTFHKTLNVVISRYCFAEDDREMYQSFITRAEPVFCSVIKTIVF